MDIALDLATNELLVGGFVLPLLLSLIMQVGWTEPVRALVFAASCIATGVLLHLTDLHDRASLTESIVLVMVSAGSLYKAFWKPSAIAPTIEAYTTLDREDREAGKIRAAHLRAGRLP